MATEGKYKVPAQYYNSRGQWAEIKAWDSTLWKKNLMVKLVFPPFPVHQKIKPTENTQTDCIRNNDLYISKGF